MVRGLIFQQKLVNRGLLWLSNSSYSVLFGISAPFGTLFQTKGQIIHALLTRAPLYSSAEANFLVRLACVRHAASVSSEPGSNSPVLILYKEDYSSLIKLAWHFNKLIGPTNSFSHYSISKEPSWNEPWCLAQSRFFVKINFQIFVSSVSRNHPTTKSDTIGKLVENSNPPSSTSLTNRRRLLLPLFKTVKKKLSIFCK